MGFLGGSDDKESACNAEDMGSILGSEDPLENGMTTHSSILAWKIPWRFINPRCTLNKEHAFSSRDIGNNSLFLLPFVFPPSKH